MGEVTFTFRVEKTLKNEFTAAAKSLDRSGAQLLRDFIQQQKNAAAQSGSVDRLK